MSKMTIQPCIEINREKIILDSVHIMPKVEREVSRLFLTKFLVEFCKQYIMRGLVFLIVISPLPISEDMDKMMDFFKNNFTSFGIYQIGNVVFSGLNPVHVILFTIPNQ